MPLPITESDNSWGKKDNAKLEHSTLPEHNWIPDYIFWYAKALLEVFQRNFEEGE